MWRVPCFMVVFQQCMLCSLHCSGRRRATPAGSEHLPSCQDLSCAVHGRFLPATCACRLQKATHMSEIECIPWAGACAKRCGGLLCVEDCAQPRGHQRLHLPALLPHPRMQGRATSRAACSVVAGLIAQPDLSISPHAVGQCSLCGMHCSGWEAWSCRYPWRCCAWLVVFTRIVNLQVLQHGMHVSSLTIVQQRQSGRACLGAVAHMQRALTRRV